MKSTFLNQLTSCFHFLPICLGSMIILGLLPAAFAQVPANDRLRLADLEMEIAADKIPKLTSLLVSQDGRLLFEAYYGAGNREHLNNTRSATKSLTALVVGRALADGKIASVDAKVLPFFSDLHPTFAADPIKSNIRLKDLLTMSSALAADDSDRTSPGNEDRLHEHDQWTPWAINLPIRADYRRGDSGYGPFHYATVNAVLAGQVVQRAAGHSVDDYIIETLFTPLGITAFKFQKSPSGEVMTGGGIELRAVDLWRIGQLVLDGGRYEGRQILPAAWIRDCLTVHETETGQPGTSYGFLFWHKDFPLGDRTEGGWFMAGNGGNLVVMFPGLHAVVVITRTAYNSRGAAAESAKMLSDYILPALRLKLSGEGH